MQIERFDVQGINKAAKIIIDGMVAHYGLTDEYIKVIRTLYKTDLDFVAEKTSITESLEINRVEHTDKYLLQEKTLVDNSTSKQIANIFEDSLKNRFVQINGQFYKVKMALPDPKQFRGLSNVLAVVKGQVQEALFFLRQEDYALKDLYELSYNSTTKSQ